MASATNNPDSWWSKDTIAVVTGSNKGIGYEIVRQLAGKGLTVVLTARDPVRGQAAVDSLKKQGFETVVFHTLDVSSSESVEKLAKWLKAEYGGIDILVNNAGIVTNDFDYKSAKDVVDTNYYGVKKVTEGLLTLLRASPAGARIINVTTRLGLYERLEGESLKKKFRDEENYSIEFADSEATQYLEDMKAGKQDAKSWPWIPAGKSPIYSESKMFLNVYAIALAKSLLETQPDSHKILVSSFCPGVTQTDMIVHSTEGGFVVPEGFHIKTVPEGAETGVWLALLPKEDLVEKTGKFYGERTEYAFGWADPPF